LATLEAMGKREGDFQWGAAYRFSIRHAPRPRPPPAPFQAHSIVSKMFVTKVFFRAQFEPQNNDKFPIFHFPRHFHFPFSPPYRYYLIPYESS